ncbi:hypothetical protein AHAS_Ahas13G0295900 [Arachis hypogaea]
MTVVTPLAIQRFSELVNKARIIEDYTRKTAVVRDDHGGTSSRGRGKYVPSRGQNFKKESHAPQRSQGRGHIGETNHDQYH